jgi:hypothetical protein
MVALSLRARSPRALTWSVSAALVLLSGVSARADVCKVLRYTFQPDCYRPAGSDSTSNTCVQSQTIDRMDLGPQIAVWIESADHTQFVETLMVTNMTGARGIGNRPGIWNFLSGPKFPYGRREMVLPIWAHARGVLYPQVIMLEPNREDWLGWHEPYSSPDPYYCRPLQPNEIAVDAITCPTKFNSEKGKFDPTAQSYYPPRTDLTTFVSSNGAGCGSAPPAVGVDPCDPRRFSQMNDLDAVATATPAYGQPFSGMWYIPDGMAEGDYVVRVEVNKEFDNNATHNHPACPSASCVIDQAGGCSQCTVSGVDCSRGCTVEDSNLIGYGQANNFGQPSVLYEVPIHLGGSAPLASSATQIAGYSNWTGADGVVIPPDGTISTADPGSGEARLLEIAGPQGMGRVQVDLEQCGPTVCPPPMEPTAVTNLVVDTASITATSADVHFSEAASGNGGPVLAYQIRYREGTTMSDADFNNALPAPTVTPKSPLGSLTFTLKELKPATSYVVGVKALDDCNHMSALTETTFDTIAMKFKQVTGCFIATAAYGSALEPGVTALRTARDRLRPTSPILAAATDLYYRSGPAAADVIRRSETARAVVRRLLGPVTALVEATVGTGTATGERR